MLKKNNFFGTIIATNSFHRLKEAMTMAPILALQDFTQPFIVKIDILGLGLDTILVY